MISSLLNFQIKVLSQYGPNLVSCQSECENMDGHLPFLFEGWSQSMPLSLGGHQPFATEIVIDMQEVQKWLLCKVNPILDQLFTNDTINRSKFPIFESGRRLKQIEKDIRFYLDTNFDFVKNTWKSGFFQIQEDDWEITDYAEYKYPILGNGFKILQVDIGSLMFLDDERTMLRRHFSPFITIDWWVGNRD